MVRHPLPASGKKSWFKDVLTGPEMVVVPPGSFTMGSQDGEGEDDERPQHRVTVAQPFAVSRFAITFHEWDAAIADGGVQDLPSKDGEGRQPVVNVSWYDAQAYVRWLTKRSGRTYRLLSEAEWEYCCRAGTTTPYSTGEVIGQQQANFGKSKYSIGHMVEVGTFQPNEWGLYDMHGNVWEWCEDRWHPNYQGASGDASPWLDGGDHIHRVVRGGYWGNGPENIRSTVRHAIKQSISYYCIGLRVAADLPA